MRLLKYKAGGGGEFSLQQSLITHITMYLRLDLRLYILQKITIKTNKESVVILHKKNIVRLVKIRRLTWLGNVEYMGQERIRQLLYGEKEGRK